MTETYANVRHSRSDHGLEFLADSDLETVTGGMSFTKTFDCASPALYKGVASQPKPTQPSR
jgi:type VI protein secretion system component Hcp